MKPLRSILLAIILIISFQTLSHARSVDITLTQAERDYLDNLGPITIGVDPDWAPYEWIDENGHFQGIAADLLALISVRLGVDFELVITSDWSETLERSKNGEFLVIPFLNETASRREWLLFTEPIFSDPSVLITKENVPYALDLGDFSGKTIVFPEGTSLEERVRNNYPELKVITALTEYAALRQVVEGNADVSLRPLTMASFIRSLC